MPNKEDFQRAMNKVLLDSIVDIFIAEKGQKLVGYILAFHHPAF